MESTNVFTKPNAIIISHADLDGISAALLARYKVMKKYGSNFDLYYNMSPTAATTNSILSSIILTTDISAVKEVYILDRSTDEKTLPRLSMFKNAKIIIVDHHISGKDFYDRLKNYSNIELHIDYNNSATKIMQGLLGTNAFSEFADLVDLWDTFKWKTCEIKEMSTLARKLNAYTCTLGSKTALNTFIENIEILKDGNIIKLPAFELIYTSYLEKIENEIERVYYKMELIKIHKNGKEIIIGYVPCYVAPELLSLVFNAILDGYKPKYNTKPIPELLFSISKEGIVSTRSSDQSNITALDFVKIINSKGGGHKHAAGCTIEPEQVEMISNIIISGIISKLQDESMSIEYPFDVV